VAHTQAQAIVVSLCALLTSLEVFHWFQIKKKFAEQYQIVWNTTMAGFVFLIIVLLIVIAFAVGILSLENYQEASFSKIK